MGDAIVLTTLLHLIAMHNNRPCVFFLFYAERIVTLLASDCRHASCLGCVTELFKDLCILKHKPCSPKPSILVVWISTLLTLCRCWSHLFPDALPAMSLPRPTPHPTSRSPCPSIPGRWWLRLYQTEEQHHVMQVQRTCHLGRHMLQTLRTNLQPTLIWNY